MTQNEKLTLARDNAWAAYDRLEKGYRAVADTAQHAHKARLHLQDLGDAYCAAADALAYAEILERNPQASGESSMSKIQPDVRHGGPYDRGSADSYYKRGFVPHYFVGGTYSSEKIVCENMTADEIIEYSIGFKDNEASGNFKY